MWSAKLENSVTLPQNSPGSSTFTKVLGLVKSESLRTLRVLGLSNITSPWTFAKSTTAKTVLRKCDITLNGMERFDTASQVEILLPVTNLELIVDLFAN